MFTRIITEMQEAGSLTSPGAYTHGYAYPVWVVTLSYLTGLKVPDLLQLYTPLVGNLFLALFTFATFRRLLGSNRFGMAAAALAFLIPEVVFTVSRGNHEKLTVSLTLLAVLALFNSYREMRHAARWRVFVAWAFTLYLINFLLISLNVVLGSSFTVATTIILVLASVAQVVQARARRELAPFVARLLVIVGINWLLVILIAAYVYPVSSRNLMFADTIFERITELVTSLLADESELAGPASFAVSDPYAVIGSDWVSTSVYHVISSFRWVLFLGSFMAALYCLIRIVRQRAAATLELLFLLAFYFAYGVLLALVIPLDFLNLSAGSNLQVRYYSYFALMAAPMLTLGLAILLARFRSRAAKKATVVALGVVLCTFAVVSMLKATLDPIVSNRWLFYHPTELQAMRFWDTHRWHAHDQPGPLWTEVQGRLVYAYRTSYPLEPQDRNVFTFTRTLDTNYSLASPAFRESAAGWRRASPVFWLDDRIYDNGLAQIYRGTPTSPFDR